MNEMRLVVRINFLPKLITFNNILFGNCDCGIFDIQAVRLKIAHTMGRKFEDKKKKKRIFTRNYHKIK